MNRFAFFKSLAALALAPLAKFLPKRRSAIYTHTLSGVPVVEIYDEDGKLAEVRAVRSRGKIVGRPKKNPFIISTDEQAKDAAIKMLDELDSLERNWHSVSDLMTKRRMDFITSLDAYRGWFRDSS